MPDLATDAEHGKSIARGGQRALAEQAHENAKGQDDPGDIPQNDLTGHCASSKEVTDSLRPMNLF
jgi:hypothetical protein